MSPIEVNKLVLPLPLAPHFFEDLHVGQRFATPPAVLTQERILAFAGEYDPQPFHIDPVAARDTIYGGLIASGFQTLAFGFRLIWDTGIFQGVSLGSPGFDELRWLLPVRPGDALRVEGEVLELRPSRSKPDRGILRIAYRYLNQRDEAVLTVNCLHLLRRRPAP
jgi:acyl dehydratase